jgi:hypothetical protein
MGHSERGLYVLVSAPLLHLDLSSMAHPHMTRVCNALASADKKSVSSVWLIPNIS